MRIRNGQILNSWTLANLLFQSRWTISCAEFAAVQRGDFIICDGAWFAEQVATLRFGISQFQEFCVRPAQFFWHIRFTYLLGLCVTMLRKTHKLVRYFSVNFHFSCSAENTTIQTKYATAIEINHENVLCCGCHVC